MNLHKNDILEALLKIEGNPVVLIKTHDDDTWTVSEVEEALCEMQDSEDIYTFSKEERDEEELKGLEPCIVIWL